MENLPKYLTRKESLEICNKIIEHAEQERKEISQQEFERELRFMHYMGNEEE